MKNPSLLSIVSSCVTAALVSAVSSFTPVAHATTFATFQLVTVTNGEDVSLRPDAYPGRIAIANRSNQPLCIEFLILDSQNRVLRYSNLRVPIPAGRTDLGLTGPGDTASSVRVYVDVGARAPCGKGSQDKGWFLNISPGKVQNDPVSPVGFDASRWTGKQRDILVEIRRP